MISSKTSSLTGKENLLSVSPLSFFLSSIRGKKESNLRIGRKVMKNTSSTNLQCSKPLLSTQDGAELVKAHCLMHCQLQLTIPHYDTEEHDLILFSF